MLPTYRAILDNDRVQWQDEAPASGRPVRVHITVLEPAAAEPDRSRGQAMADALQKIADRGGIAAIPDPAAWQRDIRQDRPLPEHNE